MQPTLLKKRGKKAVTFDEFLACFPEVRYTTRGAMVPCPSHDDRTPSLSVAEGDGGRILIRDFAGCSAKEILLAMGLTFSDLWPDRESQRWRPIRKRWRFDWRRVSADLLFHAESLQIRAETTLAVARDLTIDGWTDRELDAALGAVSRACQDRGRVELFADLGFHLRLRGLAQENRRRSSAA